jgi:hypothetical protein
VVLREVPIKDRVKITEIYAILGVRGSVVGWGTTLQAGRSRNRIPDEVDFFQFT